MACKWQKKKMQADCLERHNHPPLDLQLHDKISPSNFLILSSCLLSFFCPLPPCLFFTDQATRQIWTDATSVQSQQQPKPGNSTNNVIAEKISWSRPVLLCLRKKKAKLCLYKAVHFFPLVKQLRCLATFKKDDTSLHFHLCYLLISSLFTKFSNSLSSSFFNIKPKKKKQFV